ncbi:hypothetical protein CNMCM5793_000995 [Aspergillus hiratsukae]|uniref:Ankyrin repeat-containing domain protein n=1 Tax=Aspergillus hiratsukae TaxID=1194566 RepID=A0A8H6PLJ7_9EURO|nr:hypothetical protein CNMCM5793_000995 [Aspergillus hiratsukae]KAF7156991.1 hypothetical protein CNMCM6106_001770 [Aspergillus hiratsukae]
MSLTGLPSELILLIAGFLETQNAINALAQTNRSFYSQLNPFLYRYHAQHYIPSPALAWAAENGQLGTLVKLLQAGAEITPVVRRITDHPIGKAAANGHAKIVEILLDAGMRDSLQGRDYNLLLRHAAVENRMGVVLLLLSRGVDPWNITEGPSTICWAAHSGHAELVRLFLSDVERRGLWPAIKKHEMGEALCAAVKRANNEAVIRILLDAGAEVDFRRNDNVTTPLAIAVNFKQVSVTKLLLEAGADPNTTDSDRGGPLVCATLREPMLSSAWLWPPERREHRIGPRGQRVLVERTPLVDTLAQEMHDQLRSSPQEMMDRQMAVVRLLFEYGADPARAGGSWALHNALSSRHYEMANFLLDRGACMRITGLDPPRQAAFDRAVAERDFDTIVELSPSMWSLRGPR